MFPGPALDGKSLYELIEAEKVTLSAGVPTVWQGLLDLRRAERASLLDDAAHDRRRLGAAAGDDAHVPGALRRQVLHAWGMTEMCPVGTVCALRAQARGHGREDERYAVRRSRAARSSAST